MRVSERVQDLVRRADGDRALAARFVAHRTWARVDRRLLRFAYGRSVATEVPTELRLPPLDIPPASELPPALRESAERLEQEAERAMAHEVDLLGSGWTSLGTHVDWQRDFKSGYVWPPVFYQDLQVTRLDDDSDAKVPWELSRSHHLLALARAAVAFGRADYAAEVEEQLLDWLARNPPGTGINWANAMECSLRATNWIWALATLRSGGLLRPALADPVAIALGQHARHVARNLEGSPLLRGNHYIADILGLIMIAAALPKHPDANRWRRTARRAFEREIDLQVLPDGVGFEASTHYHGLVLEMLLLAWCAAAWDGKPLSDRFRAGVLRMLEASRGLRHPDGRIPQFGDSDSGRVLPLDSTRAPTHDHLLWLGAALLGLERPLEGDPHPEVAWTLGLRAWQRLAGRPTAAREAPREFPDGGLHVLRAGTTHAVVRAGGVGQNGNGGHAHNDALSFELSRDATPLVVDRGTFVYTADPAARNAFRGTASHNGVVVEGREINPIDPAAMFKLAQHATPALEEWSVDAARTTWRASHDGYRDVGGGLRHRRTVTLEHGDETLSLVDELVPEPGDAPASQAPLTAVSSLHVAPGTDVRTGEGDRLLLSRDGVGLVLEIWGFDAVRVEETTVSDRYGVAEPASVVRMHVRAGAPATFGYHLRPLDAAATDDGA